MKIFPGTANPSQSPPMTLIEAFTCSVSEETPGFASPRRLGSSGKRSLQSLDDFGSASPKLLSPSAKRLRPSVDDDQSTFITVSRVTPTEGNSGQAHNASCGSISLALMTAIKSWELMHSYDTLKSGEFYRSVDSTLRSVDSVMLNHSIHSALFFGV